MTVGTTRLIGKAGANIDLTHFLATDLSEVKAPLIAVPGKWSFGTGINAVNIIYADEITIADGGNTTLDLYASGSLLDIFGRALTMAAIKFLFIKNKSTDSTLKVGGGASFDLDIFAATSDIALIPALGTFFWSDPSAAGVDMSTNKNLKLEDDGAGAAGNKLIEVIAGGLD